MTTAEVPARAPDQRSLTVSRDDLRLSRLAATAVAVGVSVLYAIATWQFAARKLMWNDELYTYYMSKLPTMRDVWAALSAGGEQTPPLFYVITRTSMGVFGDGQAALRLPEMLGFWIMCASVYVFVRRRCASASALLAALVPLVTTAYMYAFEARAYGLELGCAGLALVCWQAGRGPRRLLWAAGLAVTLAATLSVHYYGILLLVPLALGEIVRSYERRRVDFLTWGAFGVAVLPLFAQLSIIRAGSGYSGTFWSPPQWLQVPDFYQDLLAPAVVPAAAILGLSFARSLVRTAPEPRQGVSDRLPPSSEIVAAAALALVPLFAVVAGKLVTGAFVNRYAIAAVIGIAALVGFASSVWFRRLVVLQVSSAIVVIAWFGLNQAREWSGPTGFSMPISPVNITRPADWVRQAHRPELPVVVAEPHSFAMLSHYGDEDIRRRVVYLADPERALKRLGHNSVERGMLDLLGPWFGMHVVSFDPYVKEHRDLLVYGDFVRLSFLNWILPELQNDGYALELLDRAGDNMLLLASRDHHS
jgi:mannosyltransferase